MEVSVVIPTYYRPKDLVDLFESILRQTVKPLEVIVVDDTPANVIECVCETYYERFRKFNIKLVYVRNRKERSLTIARNIGISLAKGEIILFLDSDIVLYPNYMEKILEVFERVPISLGVQGWIILEKVPRGVKGLLKYFTLNNLRKMFLLSHFAINRCGLFEYPVMLTKIASCEVLSGSNMAFRHVIFDEFKFDENLLRYSYMEDLLFTHSLYRRYPNSLYITPYARCIHKVSREGRMAISIEHPYSRICRKYVLMKLFGMKGLLIFGWQTLGQLTLSAVQKIWKFIGRNLT